MSRFHWKKMMSKIRETASIDRNNCFNFTRVKDILENHAQIHAISSSSPKINESPRENHQNQGSSSPKTP